MKGSVSGKLDRWIFESFEVTGEGLGLFRIFASLFLLFFLIPGEGLSHYRYLASLPTDFFAPPPGPVMLFDEFPPLLFFQTISVLLIISLLAMLIGYRTRWASVIAGVLILILQGFMYSIGKVNHQLLVPLVPIVMSFSNWGICYSLDAWQGKNKEKTVYGWPLTLLALFIAFMMFTAGFPKILGGWLDPSTQAVKGHILNQYFVKDRDALLAPFVIQIQSRILWEILDWSTILFEIGFLIAVWKARWIKTFLIITVFFHFATQLFMNISFLTNFLAYSAFLNWTKICQKNISIYQRLFGIRKNYLHEKAVLGFTGIVFLFFFILKCLSLKNIFLPDTDLMLHESILVFIAFLFAIYISVKYLLGKKRIFPEKPV